MKATVDKELCTGCGVCADTCPEVFVLDDDTARVIVNEVPEGAKESCKEAAESCPVDAITVEE
ncbi:ferredoxin [bacterium]|jgi:ferredoxin|nr:ferredoxin [bacterium]NIN92002.1 ferredoxin [bacterium]NIO18218.1 ferredoxin [bacterium]NIO73192.1 ferredoxin [bacterium]